MKCKVEIAVKIQRRGEDEPWEDTADLTLTSDGTGEVSFSVRHPDLREWVEFSCQIEPLLRILEMMEGGSQ